MKVVYFIFSCWLLTIINANAQIPSLGMYKTKNGHVVITGKIDSAIIIGESNNLLILLNCENAEMTAMVDINTISTGIGHFDNILSTSKSTAYFKGKMGIDIIKTEITPPLQFTIEGVLTLNAVSRPMKIKANLSYVANDENAGLIFGSVAISLKDFNLKEFMPNFSDLLVIQFTQVVLKKVCE